MYSRAIATLFMSMFYITKNCHQEFKYIIAPFMKSWDVIPFCSSIISRRVVLTFDTNSSNPQILLSNFNASLAGSQIDSEISLRLSRAMWKAMSGQNEQLASRMRESLQAEVDTLRMQYEIDGFREGDFNDAIAHMLEHYLDPNLSSSDVMP
jgi:hypothetical protein